MTNWFEDLTKTLANKKLSRRQAILRAASLIAGATFASAIPKNTAFALVKPVMGVNTYTGTNCTDTGTCRNGNFHFCPSNPNTNCYCFQDMNGSPVCGCNTNCSSTEPCESDSDCASGYVCITNTLCGCSTGVCVALCTGSNAKCQLH